MAISKSSENYSNMIDEVTVVGKGKSEINNLKTEVKTNSTETNLTEVPENNLEEITLKEQELKGSIIDTKDFLEKQAKNSDGTIDKNTVAKFNINMSKLGFYSYEDFSRALNIQLFQDKKIIQDQNKGIKEKDIDKNLQKEYKAKLLEMTKGDLPEGTTIEKYFGSAEKTYNKITGAYMQGSYKLSSQDTSAYEIENDLDNGFEVETKEEKLNAAEMKKVSKEVIKFFNSQSLSPQERQQIRFFIRTIAGIDRKNDNTDPIEKIVLTYFNDNIKEIPSYTKKDRKDKFEGLEIRDIDAKRLQKLGQLYYQAMEGSNPTLRRLFYIIQQEGSISQVNANFDESKEKAKKQSNYIKQMSNNFENENFENGKKLNYKNEDLANVKAYITTIKSEERQNTDTIIKSIIDFDLDGFITQKDAGNKTGPQIKQMISTFGKEKSLENILAFVNKIGEKFEIGEITKENLLLGDPAYLLLIQNSLKNPSFDAVDIIRYGKDAVENIYNMSDASTEKISTQSDKVINELKKLGIPVEAGLKDIVSTSILKAYNQSAFGFGIPLDEFIKGLSFNVGSATVPTGLESFGINIGRNGKVNLGKGRDATGGVSGGTSLVFIPMGSLNLGVMKTFENKKQSTSLDIKTSKKFILSGHAVVMPGVLGYGGSVGIDANKRESINEQGPKLQSELTSFFAKILEPAKDKDKFEFNKTELIKKLETNLKEKFDDSKKDSFTKAVNNMALILASYDGLSKDKIGDASAKIAESYANAWINQSAMNIDNKRYVGGAGLSVTFFEGIIPIVGIVNLKKHKITTYNDSNLETIRSAEETGSGNEIYKGGLEKLIEEINSNVGSEIKLEGDFIIIPKATRTEKNLEIRINGNMKELVKKNDAGDLILHKDTPIRFFDAYMSDRGRKVLNIGDFSSTKTDKTLDKKQSDIPAELITTGEIAKEKLPVTAAEKPNTENVNKILDDLKGKVEDKDNSPIKDLEAQIDGTTITFKIGDKEVGKFENITNQNKIIITKKPDGSLSFEKTESKDQKRLTIKFVEKTEITKEEVKKTIEFDDEDTNRIISQIYTDGRKITDNLFHNITHGNFSKKEYNDFNTNLLNKNYTEAQKNLIALLGNINKYKKDSFAETKRNIEGITDEFQLIKVLSAFNVLLSRTANVQVDNNGKYTYRYNKKQINNGEILIKDNANRIKNGREAYPGGFLTQFKDYRPEGSKELNTTNIDKLFLDIEKKRKESPIDFNKIPEQTKNTISFNHGNPKDYFKLQVNPEIVAGYRISLDELKTNDNEQFIEELKSAYVNQLIMTEDKLMENMIRKAGISQTLSEEQKKQLFSKDGLDLDSKIYKLDSEQNFGYNPECNNLMWLLEKIKLDITEKPKDEEEKEVEASLEGTGLAVNYTEANNMVNTQEKDINLAAGGSIIKKGPGTTPGEDPVPGTTPGEDPVPGTTPSEESGNPTSNPGETANNTQTPPEVAPTGGEGQSGTAAEGGRD